jgi:PII-like signaling protein
MPLVVEAVDAEDRIAAVASELPGLLGDGLVTLERVMRLADGAALPTDRPAKLTVYAARGGEPSGGEVVATFREVGAEAAAVLLGVDGTVGGERRRAAFFSTNEGVPLAVVAVGELGRLREAVAALGPAVAEHATVERVQVCKRDGVLLTAPTWTSDIDANGRGRWQKVTVYASERAHSGRHPLSVELVRRLRQGAAAGATAQRAVWGFTGDATPGGDAAFRLRRRGTLVTTVIDRPGSLRRLWGVIDEVTAEAGLVTTEIVPAFRASAAGAVYGGLALADHEEAA